MADLEELISDLEIHEAEPEGEVLESAVLSDEDWSGYYAQVEFWRRAQELGPEAGKIILRNTYQPN